MQRTIDDNVEPDRSSHAPSTDAHEHIDDPTEYATGLEDQHDPEDAGKGDRGGLTSEDDDDGLTETDDVVVDNDDEERETSEVLEPIESGEAG